MQQAAHGYRFGKIVLHLRDGACLCAGQHEREGSHETRLRRGIRRKCRGGHRLPLPPLSQHPELDKQELVERQPAARAFQHLRTLREMDLVHRGCAVQHPHPVAHVRRQVFFQP